MSYPIFMGHRTHNDDIHSKIFQSHLAYINHEETPSKLKQRHVLENHILDFLSIVPHEQKFSFTEIKMILERSITDNPDFSACKASLAFEALERYAVNLLSHPWRKEYKIVKLFSGFYKHSVENQLHGANTIFFLLGYQQTNPGMLFLDDLVDPDRVALVALDCLKAYAECQVILQICEKVKGYKCTWAEILNVRQEYTCGVDESVRILQQLKKAYDQCKQDKWINGREHSAKGDAFPCDREKSQNHLQTDVLVDLSSTWPSSTLPSVPLSRDVLVPQSSPQSIAIPIKSKNVYSHTKLPSWSDTSYHMDSNRKKLSRNDGTDGLSRSFEEHLQLVLDENKKDYTHPSYGSGIQAVTSPVFKSSDQKNYNSFETFDFRNTDAYNFVPNPKTMFGSPQMHFFPPPTFNNYSLPPDVRCPHTGAFHYPLCCEQPVLPPPKTSYLKDNSPHVGFHNKTSVSEDQNLPKITSEIRSPFSPIPLNKHNQILRPEPFPLVPPLNFTNNYNSTASQTSNIQGQNKRESFYDNVPSNFDFEDHQTTTSESLPLISSPQVNGTTHFNSLTVPGKTKKVSTEPTAHSSFLNKVQQPQNSFKTLSSPRISELSQKIDGTSDPKSVKSSTKDCKKWACSSCTFYNSGERCVCDMCGRSKNPGPEITPLVSGGRECPQCTLVNKKDSEHCTACGASLKDSPTYI